MYVRRRQKVKQEGERRNIFLRYLGEVADAVSEINGADKKSLYDKLLKVAKRKTAQADVKFDDQGKALLEEDSQEEYRRQRVDRQAGGSLKVGKRIRNAARAKSAAPKKSI